MPGKVKVKVLAGRHLPVMDRSNDTTDAFVEVKLGGTTCKTDVCRKSLNPQWNSEWFKFEMDDLELQDEPLQIRLMDYDTYSANDAIGKVYIDLNPLLTNPSKTKEPSGRAMSGWIPVYDTMHGIRGEVNLMVKVELFSDLNKFRQSSCGVKFFFTQAIPDGHIAIQIHGFVEELVVNDDPEYQWIDKIRTPRASNEARQLLFLKLAGEVQRRVGLKALELGGNAVIGYRVCFDLEGESGIVVRGIGTAATLTKIVEPITEFSGVKEFRPKDHHLFPPPPPKSYTKSSSVPHSLPKHASTRPIFPEKCVSALNNIDSNARPSDRFAFAPVKTASALPLLEVASAPLIKLHDSETNLISEPTASPNANPCPIVGTNKVGADSTKVIETTNVTCGNSNPKDSTDAKNSSPQSPVIDTSPVNLEQKKFEAQRRKRGSKKKDKYSTSALLKRVNETPCEKSEALTAGEKIRNEFLNFFRRRRRFLSGDTETSSEKEIEKTRASLYRKPRFDKQLFFFKPKRSCSTSRRSSSLRRSSSESFSFERISIESLPSVASENFGLNFDWSHIQMPTGEEIASLEPKPLVSYKMSEVSKVFNSETIIPSNINQGSLSSLNSTALNKLEGIPTSGKILRAINDLGYSRGEKPLTLYISSLDALLVCAPSKSSVSQAITTDSTVVTSINSTLDSLPELNLNLNSSTACQHRIVSSTRTGLPETNSNYDLAVLTKAFTNLVQNECIFSESDTNNYGRTRDAVISSGAKIPEGNIPHTSSTAPKPSLEDKFIVGKPNMAAAVDSVPIENPSLTSQAAVNGHQSKRIKEVTISEAEGTKLDKHHVLNNETIPASKPTSTQKEVIVAKSALQNSTNSIAEKEGPMLPTSLHLKSSSTGVATCQNKAQQNKTAAVPTTSAAGPTNANCRRSSESDLSTPPTGVLNSSIEAIITHNKNASHSKRLASGTDHFDLLEYPFVTIGQLPPRFIQHIGGAVSARSVKLLERISNLEEPESRDSWWTEIRLEIRSHARSICCNVILGYEEQTTICDDVCILSATGTAALVNSSTLYDMVDKVIEVSSKPEKDKTTARSDSISNGMKANKSLNPKARHGSAEESEINCSVCHIPYSESFLPFPIKMSRCLICKKGRVPDLLLATIGLPTNVPICGKTSLIQAHVFRAKKDCKGEASAKEVSDSVPFLEYELHRRLINKLKMKGMNAIFGLQVQICLGETLMIGVATGTAVCLAGLSPPEVPKITGGNLKTDTQKVAQFQKVVQDTYDRNREYYKVTTGPFGQFQLLNGNGSQPTEEDEDKEEIPNVDLATGNKDAYVLEVDDAEDIDIISELVDPSPPSAFEMTNLDTLIGYDEYRVISQQVFAQIWRCRVLSMSLRQLAGHFDRLLRAIAFKLRAMRPCVINKLRFRVELPEADEIQISIVGTAVGLAEKVKVPTQDGISHTTKSKLPSEDPDMIFNLESTAICTDGLNSATDLQQQAAPNASTTFDGTPNPPNVLESIPNQFSSTDTITSTVGSALESSSQGKLSSPTIPIPKSNELGVQSLTTSLNRTPASPIYLTPKTSSSPHIQGSSLPQIPRSVLVPDLTRTITKPALTNKGKYVVEVTTLSGIPGYRIEKYLGNLNCFFIRETTSIKEMGGPSGFVHNFIAEVLAIIRAHVAALGGNALVSYFMTELSILHNPHKNQGQCLINVGGDVVYILPTVSDDNEEKFLDESM